MHVPWITALRATIIPAVSWKTDYWMALVTVLGTTISPYLFFWQASEEAEEVKVTTGESALKRKPSQALKQFRRSNLDTRVGMALSNLIAFFHHPDCLRRYSCQFRLRARHSDRRRCRKGSAPLAGRLAFFAICNRDHWDRVTRNSRIGRIGSCGRNVPLARDLEKKAQQAPKFYLVIAAATIISLSLNFIGLNPIRALYWSAILNGIVATHLMVMIMVMSSSKAVVGKFALPVYLRIVGWTATAAMFIASAGFLVMSWLGKS